jgi:ATP-binding cassette subfamily B protein
MKNNKSYIKSEAKSLFDTLKLIHSMDKYYLPLVVIRAILNTTKYFVALIMSVFILDELLGAQVIGRLVMYVAIIIGLSFIIKLIADFTNRMLSGKMRSMQHKLYSKLSEKILSLDYEYIDNPKLHNIRQKILEYDNMYGITYITTIRLSKAITSLVEIITSISLSIALFTSVSANVSSSAALVLNSPIWAFVVLMLISLVVFVQIRATKKQGEFELKLSNDMMGMNRVAGYILFQVGNNYNCGKDIRMYNTDELICNTGIDFVRAFENYIIKMMKNKINIDKKGIIANGIFTGLVYIFVVLKAFIGAISIGSIMKYVGTIQKLSSGISGFLVSITELRISCQFLKYIHELLELPDKMYHGTLPVEKREDHQYDIEFCNVSFKYPGSEEYVLRNVSFKLRIGERLAVVGMNGAGKTTMIKLLCRLYDPTKGTIYLNGIDIKKYDYDEYQSLFSVVFQDFKLFSFPVDENVATSTEVDEKRLEDCLKSAGVYDTVKSKQKGTHTFIGKNFDKEGVDFSGGEMQKLAIARALYKDAPIVVLDEPTAALDPISEFEIYSKFDNLVGNKTAIYISHRLSSCRFCHDIMVFHEGAIIQRGSHDELIKHEGSKYHEMWNAQAQYYDETNEEMAS